MMRASSEVLSSSTNPNQHDIFFSSDKPNQHGSPTRVRARLFLAYWPAIRHSVLFSFGIMDNSVLSLVILNGFVYPVRKDEVEDLIENYSD